MGPLLLRPIVVEKPWGGGARLRALGLPVPDRPPTGEVWLVSDVDDRSSVVAGGPLDGRRLRDLVIEHPREVLGDRLAQEPPPRFPLLVKLLEVEGALSVQVHPDAENARRLGDGARGKHEAWLVLDASTRAEVALGLVSPHTPEALRALTESGELGSRLNLFHARPGDAFDIPPGTLHAARGGLVILEVQETTDVTYRLFDWQNTGPDGRRRELHVEKALACARLDTRARPPLRVPPGTSDLALPGAPFGVEIVDLRADARSLPRPLASEGGPEVWVALEGRTTLSADAHEVTLSPGQAAVVLGCTGTLQARAREGTARAARTVARVPRTREEALA